MRLVCPNCDAEYEVDDAAIPREGRDVQCSACGHAWFQEHPEVEAAREDEAALYEAPDEAEVAEVAAPVAEAPAPAAAEIADEEDDVSAKRPASDQPQVAAPEPAPPAPPARPRSLDEAVLAVLREEAEREQAARRAEATAPRLESQTEMPLASAERSAGMPVAVRRIAEMRGLARAAEPEPASPPATDTAAPASLPAEVAPVPARARSHVFPAIEEINSTLRATSDRVQDAEDAVADTLPETAARRGAFRRGFVLLVSLAVVIVALYILAPVIAARVPALEGAARAYVAAVDAGRIWLDGTLRGLVQMLKGMAGDQQG